MLTSRSPFLLLVPTGSLILARKPQPWKSANKTRSWPFYGRRTSMPLSVIACLSLLPLPGAAPAAERGSVHVRPGDQKSIPERYRLEAHEFGYDLTPQYDMPSIGVRVLH